MCALNLLYTFIGTVIQKTRELFNISTTTDKYPFDVSDTVGKLVSIIIHCKF